MSDLQAEVFPERVELEVIDSVPPVTTMGAMASFSERGLTLTVTDPAAIAAFPAATLVRASYGDHSGFCQFDSSVVEATPSAAPGGLGVIRLEPPKQVTTTQRRRFVRADVDLTIPVALLDGKAMTFLSAPGEVGNLGGGGLMMIIAAHPSLKVGSKLAVAITVPGGDAVLALGRTVQVVVGQEGPATVRLAFTSIDATDRDRIERFVYRKLGGTAPAKLWASGKITSTQPSPA
jgi:c-di-GMP-binding flagellar brake protein YcgR